MQSLRDLMTPGVTLYLQIPPDQLEAQKGLLRCWISTLIREIGSSGSESNEVLLLLDEASALGSLASLEEALVRGRSAGVRMLLAYQSDSQVQTAFKDKPTLLYDNCSTQIYLKTTSYETAERLSKSLGEWTQWVEDEGNNWGRSKQYGGSGGGGGGSLSSGGSTSRSQKGRALLRPEEILALSSDYLIAMIGDCPSPVLAKRLKWYEDPYFNPSAKKPWRGKSRRGVSAVATVALVMAGIVAVCAIVERFDRQYEISPIADPFFEKGPAKQEPVKQEPVNHGFLGVQTATLEEADAKKLGLDKPEGAVIKAVYEDTAASAAGVKADDVVLEIDGVAIHDGRQLNDMIGASPPGKHIQLQLWRGGWLTSVEAELGDWSKFQSRFHAKP